MAGRLQTYRYVGRAMISKVATPTGFEPVTCPLGEGSLKNLTNKINNIVSIYTFCKLNVNKRLHLTY